MEIPSAYSHCATNAPETSAFFGALVARLRNAIDITGRPYSSSLRANRLVRIDATYVQPIDQLQGGIFRSWPKDIVSISAEVRP